MHPTHPSGARSWVGLAVLALPTFLVAIDMTVLHLAVPKLTADLLPTANQLLWIVDIYGFTIASFLVTAGSLGDRIGRRRLLLWGTASFGAASLLAGLAPTSGWLIAARGALGLAAATLMPSTLSLIRSLFSDEAQRARAIAVWGSSFMAGTAIGPLFGGLLLEHFSWGAVFLVNLPITALLLCTAPFLLPEDRSVERSPIDLLSAVLSLLTVLTFVDAAKRLAAEEFVSSAASFALSLGAGTLFMRRQRRLADPMLDLTLFRNRAFRIPLFIQFATVAASGAPFFFASQHFQSSIGLSPLQAGMWMLPATIAGIGGSLLAASATRRWQAHRVLGCALLVAASGIFLMGSSVHSLPLAGMVLGLALLMTGSGATTALVADHIVGAAPADRAGEASALSETSGELGMALGIGVIGSLAASVYRGTLEANHPSSIPPEALAQARESIGGAMAAAENLAPPASALLVELARTAFATGFRTASVTGGAIVVFAAILAFRLRRRRSPSVVGAASPPTALEKLRANADVPAAERDAT